MKKLLYLDTADVDAVARLCDSTAISGVTTNPSLMAKTEKGDYLTRLARLASTLDLYGSGIDHKKHLSVEVTSTDPSEMLDEAIKIHMHLTRLKCHWIDFYVKIPVGHQYLGVISRLNHMKVNVNATAIMNFSQAKLASEAGAKIVSFFYNRIKDGGGDPHAELAQWRDYQSNNYLYHTRVICGSIRKPEDVWRCWNEGADIVTAAPGIVEAMCSHPETTKAVDQFTKDIQAWRS
jgi:TalC/MipB family fructose-6-phosphate aldolase